MRKRNIAIAVLLVVLALAIAVMVALPPYVKSRVIGEAAARGVVLTIDHVDVGIHHLKLEGVTASLDKVPMQVKASSIDITLESFAPTSMEASTLSIDVDGEWTPVMDAIRVWRSAHPSSGSDTLGSVTAKGAHATWAKIGGGDTALNLADVSFDVTRKPNHTLGDDSHMESMKATYVVGATNFGPWHADVLIDPDTKRIAIDLNAKAKAKLAYGPADKRTIEVEVPPSKTSELGLPALGAFADQTATLELHLHHDEKNAKAASGTLVFAGDRVFIGKAAAPTSVRTDISYEGDPKKMDLKTGTLQVGPFTGSLKGVLAVVGFSVAGDLDFQSGLMTCGDAVKQAATERLGDIAQGIANLAHALGMDQAVAGNVMLLAHATFDTRDLGKTKVDFHTQGDCALSFVPIR